MGSMIQLTARHALRRKHAGAAWFRVRSAPVRGRVAGFGTQVWLVLRLQPPLEKAGLHAASRPSRGLDCGLSPGVRARRAASLRGRRDCGVRRCRAACSSRTGARRQRHCADVAGAPFLGGPAGRGEGDRSARNRRAAPPKVLLPFGVHATGVLADWPCATCALLPRCEPPRSVWPWLLVRSRRAASRVSAHEEGQPAPRARPTQPRYQQRHPPCLPTPRRSRTLPVI